MKLPGSAVPSVIFWRSRLPSRHFESGRTRCPGDIEGLRPRVVAGALLVIPVMISQTGPLTSWSTQAASST